jgi:hypothetical protein
VTYLLEGRIHLLQRIDMLGRFEYAIITNLITGTVAVVWLLRYYDITKFIHQPRHVKLIEPYNIRQEYVAPSWTIR